MVTEFVLYASTASLTVELAVLGLLISAYYLKRKKQYRKHGLTMTAAVGLHFIPILTWMIGSLPSFFSVVAIDLSNPLILVAFGHALSGTLAAALGVWLVGAWHLQTNIKKCFARKQTMLTTITLWSIAIGLGIFLYMAVVTS